MSSTRGDVMPSYDSWRQAVERLAEEIGNVTARQQRLADVAGIAISADLPRLVAAARLQAALHREMCTPTPRPSSDGQLRFLAELDPAVAGSPAVQSNNVEAR